MGDWTRAVEDQSAPIPDEITSELGGIICNLARRPHIDQHACLSKRGKASKLGRINYMDEGRSMRAMETTPAVSLDTGKEQGNGSSDARSEGQSGDSLRRESEMLREGSKRPSLDTRTGG